MEQLLVLRGRKDLLGIFTWSRDILLEGLLEWSLIRPSGLPVNCLWIHPPDHYDLVPLGQLLLDHF